MVTVAGVRGRARGVWSEGRAGERGHGRTGTRAAMVAVRGHHVVRGGNLQRGGGGAL